MAFVAIQRLRFGDGFIEQGEPVPVEDGRNYDLMLHLGEIAQVPDEKAPKAAASQPAKPKASKAPAKATAE